MKRNIFKLVRAEESGLWMQTRKNDAKLRRGMCKIGTMIDMIA
jgi:hypothetical protein